MTEPLDMVWPLQDAKQRFSEVVRAAEKAPQIITRHGKEVAVVLDIEEYRRDHRPGLIDFLLSGPRLDDDFADELNSLRDRSLPRELDLAD